MYNIKNLNPIKLIKFINDVGATLTLSVGVEIILTTDGTDFEKEYSGIITFLNEDGIEVERLDFIKWEYIEEINIVV